MIMITMAALENKRLACYPILKYEIMTSFIPSALIWRAKVKWILECFWYDRRSVYTEGTFTWIFKSLTCLVRCDTKFSTIFQNFLQILGSYAHHYTTIEFSNELTLKLATDVDFMLKDAAYCH